MMYNWLHATLRILLLCCQILLEKDFIIIYRDIGYHWFSRLPLNLKFCCTVQSSSVDDFNEVYVCERMEKCIVMALRERLNVLCFLQFCFAHRRELLKTKLKYMRICFKKHFTGLLMCKSSARLKITSSRTFWIPLHSWEKFIKITVADNGKTFELTNCVMAAESSVLLLYL